VSAAPPIPGGRGHNPWLVAAAVALPAFMEVLDTSIANVSLRYIAGGLSAAEADAEWVITSYLAANAVVLPLSGWLSTVLGRRNYVLVSAAVFTGASMLCGMATSLPELIVFRCLQGMSGGGLQPSAQGVMLDTFPQERRGMAMAAFGMTVMVAPILGPTLGGWITETYSWRWIFYINVPTGLLALFMVHRLVRDPEYLEHMRADARRKGLRIDFVGIGLLVLGFACLETLLSKGQQWDWFGDPFGRVQWLAVGTTVGLGGIVGWSLWKRDAVVDVRVFADRNFASCSVILFCVFAVLYGTLVLLPGMLQSLMGYDALNAGLVMSPSGLAALVMLPVVGWLLGRRLDARILIALGLGVLAYGNYLLAHYNLLVSPNQTITPQVVQRLGVSLIFVPLNTAAYLYLSPEQRLRATGLYNLLRNEGGSVGTSVSQTLLERRDQFHLSRLGEHLDPFNPALATQLDQLTAYFQGLTGDPAGARAMAWRAVDDARQAQALSLAYFDCFYVFAVLALLLVPLVALMRRSVSAPEHGH
jgi:DHA2 family multidrug resistance protein